MDMVQCCIATIGELDKIINSPNVMFEKQSSPANRTTGSRVSGVMMRLGAVSK